MLLFGGNCLHDGMDGGIAGILFGAIDGAMDNMGLIFSIFCWVINGVK